MTEVVMPEKPTGKDVRSFEWHIFLILVLIIVGGLLLTGVASYVTYKHIFKIEN